MIVVNYTDFRSNMKRHLDHVIENKDDVMISRPKDKNVVVIDEDKYRMLQKILGEKQNKNNGIIVSGNNGN